MTTIGNKVTYTRNHKIKLDNLSIPMKSTIFLIASVLFSITSFAQDITGKWNGVLKVQGTQLRLTFNVTKVDNGYNSTMDSPDQGALGIPVAITTFENPTVKFEIPNARIEYKGEIKESEIVGTFKQNGQMFPMNLSRNEIEKDVIKRPQEPKEPYSYYSEDVTFQNKKANISLSGTLTLPQKKGSFPAVILISGSGPQNRNEELMGHKPFLVISDYLTKNGIAVLRYDDRGVGQSTGDFQSATSADFATDVESAISYLKKRKEIDSKKIGLIGHSEGGLIAPIVASKSKDVNFIVLLAGTGIQGNKILLLQQKLIGKVNGASESEIAKTIESNSKLFDMVLNSDNDNELKVALTHSISLDINDIPNSELPNGISREQLTTMQVNKISRPWMQYFLKYDPSTALEKVKCSVLAINGEKDLQVPAKENLTAIKETLEKGGNKDVTIKEYPNLNHLFQECETGSPNEYSVIEQTISPVVLKDITEWVKERTK